MDSKTQAKLGNAKVNAPKRAKLNVRVTSRYVSNVTGKVKVKISGHKKKLTERLTATDKGKAKIQLPKLKPGKYQVKVKYAGSNTVAPSKDNPVKLTVK